ncbi:MAG: SDR family oxidoreductase [Nitrospirae bacterium]|nr:SDR family oxidoreductase [Nitrospirota bacterium]
MVYEEFRNKTALITGSSRGIGRSIAMKFAQMGSNVVVNYRRPVLTAQGDAVAAVMPGAADNPTVSQAVSPNVAKFPSRRGGGVPELCREIESFGVKVLPVQADISKREEVKSLFDRVRERFGSLDFLILNAAKAPFKPIEKLLEKELRDLVDVNYLGNIFCVKEALPLLEASGGKVVFISSLGSRFYNPAYPLGSMKAAMEAVVRDLSETLGERGISVNAVSGGIVRTDSFKVLRQFIEDIDRLPDELFVDPDEIADVVAFLSSGASRAIRGQTIVVDRGLSNRLHRPIKNRHLNNAPIKK